MFHCSIASCKGDHPVFAIDAYCIYSCIPPNRHLLHHVVALQHSGSGNSGIEEVSTEVPHMGKGEWMPYFLELFLFQGDEYLVIFLGHLTNESANAVFFCKSFWFPYFDTEWLIVYTIHSTVLNQKLSPFGRECWVNNHWICNHPWICNRPWICWRFHPWIFWWPKHEVETVPGSQVAMMWTHHLLPRTNQPDLLSPPSLEQHLL